MFRIVGDGGQELFLAVPSVDTSESDLLEFANTFVIPAGEESIAVIKKDCVLDAIT